LKWPPWPQRREERTQYQISAEQFALTWNDSQSTDEACERLGMPRGIVLARVSNYRKRGIKMKKMPRKNSRRLDVDGINQANKVFCPDASLLGLPDLVLVVINEAARPTPPRGLCVRLHLLDGTADGLRIMERPTSTLQAVVCPRSRFQAVRGRPEFQKPGTYVLAGQETLYVGEGDPTLPRLDQHCTKKNFWTSLYLFLSKDESLHKAHAQHLESRLTALARAAARATLDNVNYPQPPSLCEADVAEAESYLDEVLLLSRLLGLNVFEPVRAEQEGGGRGHP
jgi:hypothetical protein